VAAPFGLAADGGGTLHLVGVGAGGAALLYSSWDGARWSAPETPWLRPEVAQGLGAAAATAPAGGQLAVALLALPPGIDAGAPAVFYASRAIPSVDVVDVPPPATPFSDATAAPSPTPDPTPAPSPTPDLSGDVDPAGSTQLPLVLGGGLAVVIVVGVLVAWGARRGRGSGR
ncbi:MAG: hypothetical protein JW918_20040, partial [Anaerolineae bacterium]|nr:hypothetical protein [Anaerolineae bacterium]